MTTVADFVGRRIDLSLFSNVPTVENDNRLLVHAMSVNGVATVCTGVQKLAQRVLMRLFTVKGSRRYQPDEGCLFMADAAKGVFRSTANVVASFAAARTDILIQFAAERYDTDPLDEVLVDLRLDNVLLALDGVAITVRITTAAGSTRKLIAPLPIVI